ncbi:hypothetical protein D9M68_504970 [compost metagenome]
MPWQTSRRLPLPTRSPIPSRRRRRAKPSAARPPPAPRATGARRPSATAVSKRFRRGASPPGSRRGVPVSRRRSRARSGCMLRMRRRRARPCAPRELPLWRARPRPLRRRSRCHGPHRRRFRRHASPQRLPCRHRQQRLHVLRNPRARPWSAARSDSRSHWCARRSRLCRRRRLRQRQRCHWLCLPRRPASRQRSSRRLPSSSRRCRTHRWPRPTRLSQLTRL